MTAAILPSRLLLQGTIACTPTPPESKRETLVLGWSWPRPPFPQKGTCPCGRLCVWAAETQKSKAWQHQASHRQGPPDGCFSRTGTPNRLVGAGREKWAPYWFVIIQGINKNSTRQNGLVKADRGCFNSEMNSLCDLGKVLFPMWRIYSFNKYLWTPTVVPSLSWQRANDMTIISMLIFQSFQLCHWCCEKWVQISDK